MVLSKEKLNFQSVIEIVESLSDNEQEHLIKIINHRLKQKEKKELYIPLNKHNFLHIH